MKRSDQREQIFLLLFRVEFNDEQEMQAQEDLFFSGAEKPISEKDTAYILSLIHI